VRTAVIGAGSWGTALAVLLAEGGHEVTLWGRDVEALARDRENRRYLPGRRFPDAVRVTGVLDDAARAAELVVVALPSTTVRAVTGAMAGALPASATFVCASKGLEGRLTMNQVIAEAAPGRSVVMLSGPTFALEIARGLPGAAVAASTDVAAAERVQSAFSGGPLRVYTTEDVVGVAIGGALKNVIAIAAGISDGLGLGHNTRAAIITRGLHEIGRLAARLGGNPLTLAGLAGLGDLVLTCTDDQSRNRRFGLLLAAGRTPEAALAEIGQAVEGYAAARAIEAVAARASVEMPLCAMVYRVLYEKLPAREAVRALMGRPIKAEAE
jgi:glycerol-3-phosphate dehydrogenase (NAD(P)+)